jgi:hypothetical protein
MEANVDSYDLDLCDLFDYLKRLERVDSLLKKAQRENQTAQKAPRNQEIQK